MPLHDTTLIVNGRKVLIKICDTNKKGTFLMLQGWNLPVEDWYTKTSICQKAISQGYCIVLPDMGKSIYHEKKIITYYCLFACKYYARMVFYCY